MKKHRVTFWYQVEYTRIVTAKTQTQAAKKVKAKLVANPPRFSTKNIVEVQIESEP